MPEEGPHLDGLCPPRFTTPAPNAKARSAVLMLVCADLIEFVNSAVSQIPTLIISGPLGSTELAGPRHTLALKTLQRGEEKAKP